MSCCRSWAPRTWSATWSGCAQALGEETISFLGLSYGTSIGARYADRYPDRVRAFALDSGLPAVADPATFVPEWVDAIERAFDAYLADCAAALTCPFHSGGDPAAAFDALMAQVDAAPLEVPTESGTRLVGQRAVLDAVDWRCCRGRRGGRGSPPPSPPRPAGTVRRCSPWPTSATSACPTAATVPAVTSFLAVGCLDFAITTDPAAYKALAAKAATDRPPPRRLLRDVDPALRLLAGAADAGPARTRRRRRAADPGGRRHARHPGRLLLVGGHGGPAGVRRPAAAGGHRASVLLEQRLRRGCGQRLPA